MGSIMKNTNIGLLGVLGIWITMSMMPLAELMHLSAFQLLVLRGLSGVLCLGALMLLGRSRLFFPDKYTLMSCVFYVLACIGLFQGITTWGASLTAVLLDMAVLVPIAFAMYRKERVSQKISIVLAVALAGSFFALRGWDSDLKVEGFLWGMMALLMNGLFIEYGSRARQPDTTKVFWLSLTLVLVGSVCSLGASWHLARITDVALAVWFSCATGVLNFMCAFVAFRNLRPVWMGILILGVTPSILVSTWIFLGTALAWDQLVGVGLVLCAVGYLGFELQKRDSPS
jgi:drug/metabolite transporter (DMT)-like permease